MKKLNWIISIFLCVIMLTSCGYKGLSVGVVLDIPSISIDDVIKVKREDGFLGVAPGSKKYVSYSSDSKDINNVLSVLDINICEDKTNEWQIDGGSYTCYSIFTNENKYNIYISNGYIHSNDKHYRYNDKDVVFENASLSANSYIVYGGMFDAYNANNEKIGTYSGLSEFEFIDYIDDSVFEKEELGYLDTEIGIIYILTDNIFYVKDDDIKSYYLIVGEKKFDSIFTS